MDFRLDDGQRALQETVGRYCSTRFALDAIAGREELPFDRGAWKEMGDLGVFGVMLPEADGGSGLGAVEAAIVFEQLGQHVVRGPLVWSTLAAPYVHGAAAGDVVVAGTCVDDGDPIVVEHAADADRVLVLRTDGASVCRLGDLAPGHPGQGLDPLSPTEVYETLPLGDALVDAAGARDLHRLGTLLTAAFALGVSAASLDVARDYSMAREQFGVPIGSFQALKHILADMLVRTSLARSAAYAAAAVLDDPELGDPDRAVHGAKLLAGEAAVENARAAVQVLGGMGFTWDMPPNYLLKRAWVLDQSFGNADEHALALAHHLEAEVA